MKARDHMRKMIVSALYRCIVGCIPALILVVLSPTFAAGDVLKITPQGAISLRALLTPLTDGKGFFVRGRIVIQRDAAGRPSLKFPYKYLMFQPSTGPNTYGPARQIEWAWIASSKQEIDSLDDLRGIVSNRDLRYGSWDAALDDLLLEADTDDSIYHLRLKRIAQPPVVNGSIALAEGWLGRDLIAGHQPNPAEQIAYQNKFRGMPAADPLGYRPNDPLFQSGTGEITIVGVLDAIARAEKYGEPEPGFLDAARKVARFMCESVYPPADALSGPSRDKAMYSLVFSSRARGGLFGTIQMVRPDLLGDRLKKPSRFGTSLVDRLRSEYSYIPFRETAPITYFDVAKAAIGVMGDIRTARDGDAGTGDLINALLNASSGRADFQATETGQELPADVLALENTLGTFAFETLAKTAAGNAEYRSAIVDAVASFDYNTEAPVFGQSSLLAAGGEAIVRSGIGKVDDVVRVIDRFWIVGLAAGGANGSPWVKFASSVLKRAGPAIPDATLRGLYQKYLTKKIRDFQERQDIGQGSLGERQWLALFK